MTTARNINSAKPYAKAARTYLSAGWSSPLPVAKGQKEGGLPIDRTGRGKPYATEKEVKTWISSRGSDNICLRMMTVETLPEGGEELADAIELDVIGIDVDDYESKGKTKHGARQLKELEKEYGKLPPTWRSTNRGADNPSGIRFFLAPAGLHWRGKAHKDIDIISPGYRYAVVWPSWHPEGRQYVWLDASGNETTMPEPTTLPHLPEAWVELLTNGHMPDTGVDIDMDSSVDEIRTWVLSELPGSQSDTLCDKYQGIVDYWSRQIEEDASSHDKILEAHWNMACMATEGHRGWLKAVTAVENIWIEDVKSRGKRTLDEFRREIFRSGVQAMRKLKGEIESGRRRIRTSGCTCYRPSDAEIEMMNAALQEPSNQPAPPRRKARNGNSRKRRRVAADAGDGDSDSVADNGRRLAPASATSVEPDWDNMPTYGDPGGSWDDNFNDEWESADDTAFDEPMTEERKSTLYGESKDDLDEPFSESSLVGRDGYWPSGLPGGKPKSPGDYEMSDRGNAEHWSDIHKGNAHFVTALNDWIMWTGRSWILGDGAAQRSYERVGNRQRHYAETLTERYYALQNEEDPSAKSAGVLARKWTAWADRSGNVGQRDAALKYAQTLLHIEEHDLNARAHLLACTNGVVDLDVNVDVAGVDARLRQTDKRDGITLNTGCAYIPWEGLLAGDGGAEAASLAHTWDTAVRQMMPDTEVRDYVQKLCGYTLHGRNSEKLSVFLFGGTNTGKSTFLNAIMNALGEYAAVVDLSIFKERQTNPQLVYALPKRLITMSEGSDRNQLHADVFKRLTGGDPISAELKYSNERVTRVPSFVPWIATNVEPNIPGADLALIMRMRVVPFDETIVNQDGRRWARLTESKRFGAVVLSWIVQGWNKYQAAYRSGFECLKYENSPVAVKVATDTFTSEFSDLSIFVKRCLVRAEHANSALARKVARSGGKKRWPNSWVSSYQDVYDLYIEWCSSENIRDADRLTRNAFSRQMKGLGYVSEPGKRNGEMARYYFGVRMTPPPGIGEHIVQADLED